MSFRPQLSGALSAKLNAAGLSAEHSLLLPEREPQGQEMAILQSIGEIYAAVPSETTFAPFANDVILTLPNGDVVVGSVAFRSKFEESWKTYPARRTQLRLLETPESLAEGTLCLDVVMSLLETAVPESPVLKTVRSLIVLRRRSDGLISGMTEEEGHRRATAPLAARTAAASNFYSHSPTDNMVSPCTSKLNLSKKKHFMKAKPTTLFPGAVSRTPSSLSRQESENDGMSI